VRIDFPVFVATKNAVERSFSVQSLVTSFIITSCRCITASTPTKAFRYILGSEEILWIFRLSLDAGAVME